jgi:hypothetical protein
VKNEQGQGWKNVATTKRAGALVVISKNEENRTKTGCVSPTSRKKASEK